MEIIDQDSFFYRNGALIQHWLKKWFISRHFKVYRTRLQKQSANIAR
jgi:hypothetical protein